MITCEWLGRLGNNMFQIAATYGLAYHFNEKAEFPNFPHFDLPLRSEKVKNMYVQKDGQNKYIIPEHKENMSIVGFFQKHEYFDHIKESLIKSIFKVPIDCRPNTICIHVRRGDFLYDPINFPTQPKSFYLNALNTIGSKDKKIVFCSDDIDWCKENFSDLPNVSFREFTTALSDIYFGANCESVIMSNSTFSFWMAYLSMRKRTIVFPLNWFNKDSGRTGYEICPNDWIGLT